MRKRWRRGRETQFGRLPSIPVMFWQWRPRATWPPKYASDGQHGHQQRGWTQCRCVKHARWSGRTVENGRMMEHHDGSRGRRPGGNRDEVSRSAWVRKKGRNARVKLGRLRDHCLAYVNGRLIGPRARRELPVPVTMVGVWRTKNLEVVRALVAQLPDTGQIWRPWQPRPRWRVS